MVKNQVQGGIFQLGKTYKTLYLKGNLKVTGFGTMEDHYTIEQKGILWKKHQIKYLKN